MSNILAIDIGNTHAAFAVFSEDLSLLAHITIPTDAWERLDEVADAMLPHEPARAAIASGRPDEVKHLQNWCADRLGVQCRILGSEIPVPVANLLERPQDVGMDRLVNALAAFRRTNGATVVIDLGTAVTFDVVNGEGGFEGGVIMPGLKLSLDALIEKCALLPELKLDRPTTSIGGSTFEAMNAGMYFGMLGAVEGVLSRIQRERGEKMAVLVTGGDAKFFASDMPFADDCIPHLTLEGIALAELSNQ